MVLINHCHVHMEFKNWHIHGFAEQQFRGSDFACGRLISENNKLGTDQISVYWFFLSTKEEFS